MHRELDQMNRYRPTIGKSCCAISLKKPFEADDQTSISSAWETDLKNESRNGRW